MHQHISYYFFFDSDAYTNITFTTADHQVFYTYTLAHKCTLSDLMVY